MKIKAIRQMDKIIGFYLILFIPGSLIPVDADCNGTVEVFNDVGDPVTRHPHYPHDEYNKSANCSWEFHPESRAFDHAVVLNITKLRLFVTVRGQKVCLGSYNLSINNEEVPCEKYVGVGANGICYAYYDSSSCSNISEIQNCEKKTPAPHPISMKYISDGRVLETMNVSSSMFFIVQYRIIQCPQGDTTPAASITTNTSTPRTKIFVSTASSFPVSTTAPPTTPSLPHTTAMLVTPPDATTSTSTRPVMMSQLVTTAKPTEISEELTSLVKSSSHQSNYSTREILSPQVTETISIKPSIAGTRGVTAGSQIIIAAGGGGGLVLIVIVVVVLCVCKRRRRRGANQDIPLKGDKSGKSLAFDQTYSRLTYAANEISGESTYNTLAEIIPTSHSASPDSNGVDLYDVLGGENPSNQAAPKASNMTDISGEDTYNVLGEVCPINHSDSKVCDEMVQSGEGTYEVLRGVKLTGRSASATYEEVELLRDERYDKSGGTKPSSHSVKGTYEEVDLEKQLTYDTLDGSQDEAISSQPQVEPHAAAPSLPSTYDQSQSEMYTTVSKSIKL